MPESSARSTCEGVLRRHARALLTKARASRLKSAADAMSGSSLEASLAEPDNKTASSSSGGAGIEGKSRTSDDSPSGEASSMSLVSSRHTSEPPSGEAASDNKVGEAASDNKVGEPASDKSARIIADMGKHAEPVSVTPVSQNADKSRAGPCLRIPAEVASLVSRGSRLAIADRAGPKHESRWAGPNAAELEGGEGPHRFFGTPAR